MSTNLRQPLVGKRLRELREQHSLTRAELSAATGVSTSAIVRLEHGHDVRLSNYFPILIYLAQRDAELWAVAERVLLLSEQQRASVIAVLDAFGGSHE